MGARKIYFSIGGNHLGCLYIVRMLAAARLMETHANRTTRNAKAIPFVRSAHRACPINTMGKSKDQKGPIPYRITDPPINAPLPASGMSM